MHSYYYDRYTELEARITRLYNTENINNITDWLNEEYSEIYIADENIRHRFNTWKAERAAVREALKEKLNSSNSPYRTARKSIYQTKRNNRRDPYGYRAAVRKAIGKYEKQGRSMLGLTTLYQDIYDYSTATSGIYNHANWRAIKPEAVFQPKAFLRFVNESSKYSFRKLPIKWRDTLDAHQTILASYLPHVSEDKTRLAYCQSYEKFTRGDEPLYTVTTPGKFLKMLCDKHDICLDENTLRKLAEEWIANGAPHKLVILDNNDPKWVGNEAALKAEWVRVYENAVVDYSCMRNNPNGAVELYGVPGNSIGLAYWERGDGSMYSRTVVNVVDKTYIRVYPSASSDHGISLTSGQQLIEQAGYTQDDDCLDECIIEYREGYYGDRIICPYIDGNNPTVSRVRVNGTRYLRIYINGNGEFGAQNTDDYGYVSGQDRTTCPCCGDHCDEDDMSYIESRGESICCHCRDRDYTLAYTSDRRRRSGEEYVHNDDVVEVNGEFYSNDPDVLSVNDIHYCDECDTWYAIDDMVSTSDSELHCNNCAVSLSYAHYSDAEYQYALPGDTTETHDGETILEEDAVTISGVVFHKNEEHSAEALAELLEAA